MNDTSPPTLSKWLTIESMDLEAQGIAHREDGKVVFVDGALPFEVVVANVNRKKDNWENAPMLDCTRAHVAAARCSTPTHRRKWPSNNVF